MNSQTVKKGDYILRNVKRSILLVFALFSHYPMSFADPVDEYIRNAMIRQHIPGLSLVILRNGKVIKSKGYGWASVELSVPATPQTVYELASATKPMVASGILLLNQAYKLHLDDPINQYLDSIPPTWHPITIRHLLTHTSGIPDYLADMRRDFPNQTSPKQVMQAVGQIPLKFLPGQRWSYSNTGYILLGMIIQRVSGMRYDEFLQEQQFKPLGMKSTRRDSPDEIVTGRANGYVWKGPAGLRNGDFL
jgi:CubicO group peptidase (beta-lactamase class C family)